MALSDKIQVTDLEFDDIKTNLKTYLKAQTKFQDYDFGGLRIKVQFFFPPKIKKK